MVANVPDSQVNFLRSRRALAAFAVFLLLLFVFRPGVRALRNRISASIGNALGRRVAIDNVRLHPLPRPGFDLEGLVVYDDPSFSAEPMIRAQDVFAAIRLRSALRGRLEIASLSATEPSINIVRSAEGRWNLADLIARNAQIPAAPTQKAASERRPAFPYLEATNARVNFKFGAVKTSYALIDADVTLWQDSENSWGARLRAQPVRTDFNLTDTGQLQMSASWQRAPNLLQTPLRMTVSWEKGQLGQITTLLTGKDRGWRGNVDISASLLGTPQSLTIENQIAIQGFRRYDIVDNRNIRLAAHCGAKYDAGSGQIAYLLCESPIRSGMIRLSGDARLTTRPVSYDLKLEAQSVPLTSVVELAHEAKRQLPGDLTGDGLLNGEFHAARTSSEPAQFDGSAIARGVHLESNGGTDSISLNEVALKLVEGAGCCKLPKRASKRVDANTKENSEPAETQIRIEPAALVVNASPPVSAGGWVSISGYHFFLLGDIELKNLFQLERTFGIPAVQPAADGSAKVDLSVSGSWRGLAAPNTLGTAQLRNVRAEMRGLSVPVEIASATLTLAPDMASMQLISARVGATHWTGSARAPRHCAPACLYQFDFNADQLSTDEIVHWFAASPEKRPWYRILRSADQAGPSPLLKLRAHGSLQVTKLEMKKVMATQVTTELTVDQGKLTLDHLQGELLQGSHKGDWVIDATSRPLQYRGTGVLRNISLQRLGALMNDDWITGNADGTFSLETSGASMRELLSHSNGTLVFLMSNGAFTHISFPGAPVPLPVHRFTGSLSLKDGGWQLSAGRLESRDGIYQVKGTSSPLNGLDVIFTRGDEQSWNVKGTIARPHVVANRPEVSRTEARVVPATTR